MLSDVVKKVAIYDKDLARMIPRTVDIAPDDPRCQQIADEIRKFYFAGGPVTKTNMADMAKLQTDFYFSMATHLAAELHARYEAK